jgi:hypothetical protein
VPELWVPGFAGPVDDLIDRIVRRIQQFAEEFGIERPSVEIELADGARYDVEALTANPGYGFVTIHPHPQEDVPAEVIVPIGSIKRIELSKAGEERGRLGFSPASDPIP